jgi:hypothetical protein
MVESVMAYSVGDTYTQSQMTSLLGGKSDVSTTGAVLIYSGQLTLNSTATVANLFNSTYDNYLIVHTAVSGTSSASDVTLRFNNGSDLSTGIYSYNFSELYSGSYTNSTPSSQTSFYLCRVDSTKPKAAAGSLYIHSPFLTQEKILYGESFTKANSGNNITNRKNGVCETTLSCSAFSLISSSGTVVMNIKVYGYK